MLTHHQEENAFSVIQEHPQEHPITTLRAKRIPPAVPLFPDEQPEPKKGECLKLDLRANPADPTSETYGISVRFFKDGTPAEWLVFLKTFTKVIVGQNLTTGPSKYAMARQLLQGDALREFNNEASQNDTETNANFQDVMKAVTKHFAHASHMTR